MSLKYRIYLLVMVFGLSTTTSNSQTPNVIEGEILVHLNKKAKAESLITDFNKTAKSPQLKLKKCVSKYMNIWLLEYDFKSLDGNKLLGKLDVNDHVKTAQFNHKIEYRSTSKEPNDSIFSLQWQYVNRGTGGGTNDADIDVDSAWSITTGGVTATGDTIVVAIVDDGVDHDHPGVAGKPGPDFIPWYRIIGKLQRNQNWCSAIDFYIGYIAVISRLKHDHFITWLQYGGKGSVNGISTSGCNSDLRFGINNRSI